MSVYACPTCKARSRFNLLEQVVRPIKVDQQTQEIRDLEQIEPFHLPYNGPRFRVQCATCGTIEEEQRFIKTAKHLS